MVITYIATFVILTLTTTNAELEVVAGWRLATSAPPPGFPGASPYGYPVYAPSALFTGIQASEDKFFLSIPRFLPGQPITLGWVPRPKPGQQLPLDTPINAFPDWDWHRAAAGGAKSASTNCSALVCVFHTKLDRCGRLWVLDSGISNTFSSYTASCPPKLLAFNTTTGEVVSYPISTPPSALNRCTYLDCQRSGNVKDRVAYRPLHRYEFETDVFKLASLFTNFVLDSRSPSGSSCSRPDDYFVYITDTKVPGIIVYDARKRVAWRHDPRQAHQDPDWGVYTIAGESFTLMDGALGITLSNPIFQHGYGPKLFYSERILYFQAFASDRIYSVPTSALRAQPKDNVELPIKLIGRMSSQSAPLIANPTDGSLVFAPISETAIASFQPAHNTLTVKAYNPDLLQGVTDLYFEPEQIWATSTRMQKYFRGTVSANEVNLRILRIPNPPQAHYHH